MSKLLDKMVAYELADHIKGLFFILQASRPSFSHRFTNLSRRIPVFDAKLLVDCVANPLSLSEAHHVRSDRAGDQICIFGFSRGAYTARALAGMLQKVGLLPTSNLEQLPFAYAMYAKDDEEGRRLSTQFKQTFSIHVTIKFLGVWYVIQHIDQSPIPYLHPGTP